MKRNKSNNGNDINWREQRALAIVTQYAPGVRTVRDAKRDVEVSVTSADAKAAGRKSHGGCALAEACKREIGADSMIVSSSRIYVIKGNEAIRYVVPAAISREIVAFDRGAKFDPGTYRLKRPSYASRLGAGWGGAKGKRRGTRAKAHVTAGIRASIAHPKKG